MNHATDALLYAIAGARFSDPRVRARMRQAYADGARMAAEESPDYSTPDTIDGEFTVKEES